MIFELTKNFSAMLSLSTKSVIYDGDVYYDCLEEFVFTKKSRLGSKIGSSSKLRPVSEFESNSSGYSSDSDDTPLDWQELAFEELGETAEVRILLYSCSCRVTWPWMSLK